MRMRGSGFRLRFRDRAKTADQAKSCRKSRQCIKSLCEAALARATPAAGCVDDGRADRVLRLAPYSQKYDIEDVAFLARRPFVWSCLFRVRSFHGPASFLEGLPETVSGFAPDRPLNCGQSPPHEIAIPCRGAMPAPSLAFGERSAELRGAPARFSIGNWLRVRPEDASTSSRRGLFHSWCR
jgi:hypothetical protein